MTRTKRCRFVALAGLMKGIPFLTHKRLWYQDLMAERQA